MTNTYSFSREEIIHLIDTLSSVVMLTEDAVDVSDEIEDSGILDSIEESIIMLEAAVNNIDTVDYEEDNNNNDEKIS